MDRARSVIRAIDVLERLSAPLREADGWPLLWLQQAAPGSAFLSSQLTIQSVSVNAMNERLNHRLAPLIDLPGHDGKRWRLASHQGRKTFARFVGRRDRTGLAALAKHLGHVTRAMTDRSYVVPTSSLPNWSMRRPPPKPAPRWRSC